MKTIFVNEQWQGGADISTLYGAREIEKFYLKDIEYDKAEISDDEKNLNRENDIVGYDILKKQMVNAFQHLENVRPDKLFIIGGGCDADYPSMAYMNKKYKGKLKILYFDAHGDINSPEESESKLFYGMPLRCLIEDTYRSLFPITDCGIAPEQIVHIGARDLDDAETHFMDANEIKRIAVDELMDGKIDIEKIISADDEKIYIHLDLDVLVPREFTTYVFVLC